MTKGSDKVGDYSCLNDPLNWYNRLYHAQNIDTGSNLKTNASDLNIVPLASEKFKSEIRKIDLVIQNLPVPDIMMGRNLPMPYAN